MDATQGKAESAAHGSQAIYYDDSAALYADPKIRLHYPPELYERVYAFAGPAAETALDVACGTGQCAAQLAKRYKQARHPSRPSTLESKTFHAPAQGYGPGVTSAESLLPPEGCELLLLPRISCIPAPPPLCQSATHVYSSGPHQSRHTDSMSRRTQGGLHVSILAMGCRSGLWMPMGSS